jgi:WD40 repeat protein
MAVCFGGIIRTWDATSGASVRVVPLSSLQGHTEWAQSASLSADGARIVTRAEKVISICDTISGM